MDVVEQAKTVSSVISKCNISRLLQDDGRIEVEGVLLIGDRQIGGYTVKTPNQLKITVNNLDYADIWARKRMSFSIAMVFA